MTPAEPLFVSGSMGRLFALYIQARGARQRGVLMLPPFAEEMNRSRRMLRLQAAALAGHGIATLLLDPFGTGDSAGDFADARWETWIADVRIGADVLLARGVEQLGLLGLRLGATLGAAAAPVLPHTCFATVFWQAVVHGDAYLDEVLRRRTLPGALNDGAAITINEMRATLRAGKPVEVAGYEIVPEMAAAFEGLDLFAMAHPALGSTKWFELVPDTRLPLSRAGTECIETWRDIGFDITGRTIAGPMFWSGQGNAISDELIAATCAAFESAP
jgi:exosortase A-associated hydrolase 2